MKKTALLLAGVLLITSAYAEPTRTVEWYRNHASERADRIAICRNNPGELRDTPNCINAERAESVAQSSKTGVPYFKPLTPAEYQQRLKELQGGAPFGR